MQLRKYLLINVLLVASLTSACQSCGSSNNAATSDNPSPSTSPATNTAATTVSFVIFGDWGTEGTGDAQEDVATAIKNYCQSASCQFILTLGDNFYNNGVTSTTDPLWQRNFRNVYDSLGLPFYVALGNHDSYGNIQAEIDYSSVDPNWHFPAQDYSFTMPDGSATPLVEFFIFNSNYPHFRYDGSDEARDGYDAPTWLKNAMTASQARWKFLVMHHPIYSDGHHGDDEQGNNAILFGREPHGSANMLCDGSTARIDLALSGHDHDFAHLRGTVDGCPIEQLVVGTGGANIRTDVKATVAQILKRGNFNGFGWLEVTDTQVRFRMIDASGGIFYETSWQKN